MWNCVSGPHLSVTAVTLVIPTWRSPKLKQGKMAEQLLCPSRYQCIVIAGHYSPGTRVGHISHVIVLETPRSWHCCGYPYTPSTTPRVQLPQTVAVHRGSCDSSRFTGGQETGAWSQIHLSEITQVLSGGARTRTRATTKFRV